MQIHPQSLVSPRAELGRDVRIGPFCVIEDDVVLGDGTVLDSRVTIKRGTVLGENNHVFEGAVLGGLPQCVGMTEDEGGRVVVGSGNTIRENVTIHRSMEEDEATEVGDSCMLMVNAHVAHDCRVADGVIMANNAMLAGHVVVGTRAFISGAVGVHQFCRIGAFAMVGGQAHITRDIPPYLLVDGLSSLVVGLNRVGLRRAGFSPEDIKTIKTVYRIIYDQSRPWSEILKKMEREYTSGPGLEMARFIAMSSRGIIPERRQKFPPEPTPYKLHLVGDDESAQYHRPTADTERGSNSDDSEALGRRKDSNGRNENRDDRGDSPRRGIG